MTTGLSRQFAHRRLRRSVEGLRALREELRIVEEQLAVLDDDARDAEVRALVAETPAAAAEMHDTSRHDRRDDDAPGRAARLARAIGARRRAEP